MTAELKGFDELVVARLRNFFHHNTPWQRALWSVASITGLHEVVEYCESGAESHLPNEGMKYVAESMAAQSARDLGLGTDAVRKAIDAALSPFAHPSGKYPSEPERSTLRHLAERCREGYLERWAMAVRPSGSDGESLPGVEVTARCIASHLLDSGLSSDFLDEWLKKEWTASQDLPEILLSADAIIRHPIACWEVFIPVENLHPRLAQLDNWIEAPDAVEWLQREGKSPLLLGGALCINVDARDPWSAVRIAHEHLTRTADRVQVGLRRVRPPMPLGSAYVAGQAATFALLENRRRIEIPNLATRLEPEVTNSHVFDDAVSLAASMYDRSPGASVTGGWAAIEGLLLLPQEVGGQRAADRMASIIACSFARAELHTIANALAYFTASTSDDRTEYQGLNSYARARKLEERLREGHRPILSRRSDQAALLRLVEILDSPKEVLARVRHYVAEALRRLYNQRNIIMHSGTFRSCALQTTIRTTPSLVGAGLDRIAFALAQDPPVNPLDLAARADAELALLGQPGGRWLVDLLS